MHRVQKFIEAGSGRIGYAMTEAALSEVSNGAKWSPDPSFNRHDLGPGDHRHGLELEGVEGLARQEVGFGEMALDAAAIALGEFVFGDGGEETGSGPAFLIGLFGEFGP